MKTELTEEIEVIKKRLSEVAGTGKYDTILFHPGTAQLFLSLLTKQEEQPQANDAEEWLKGWRKENCTEQAIFSSYHIDAMEAFHLSQTKKMLEGWTDEKIMAFVSEDEVLSTYEYGMTEGAKQFRDELLKQLEG